MVNVRPSARTVSTFTLRREGTASEPRVLAAGIGDSEVVAAPIRHRRDEGETAWRLRHLKRSILKDATTYVAATSAPDRNWFLTDSFYYLGRAVGSSARAAGSLFSSLPLQGQVNLLTTSAFDNPFQLLQRRSDAQRGVFRRRRARRVTRRLDREGRTQSGRFELVDRRRQLRAARAGRPSLSVRHVVRRAPLRRRQPRCHAAVPDTSRNVGAVYVSDEWKVTDRVTLGYGGNYAHYDYLGQPAYLSPRVSTTINAADTLRIRAHGRATSACAGRGRIPPSDARAGAPAAAHLRSADAATASSPKTCVTTKSSSSRSSAAQLLRVRAFQQRVDDQLITVFGMRTRGRRTVRTRALLSRQRGRRGGSWMGISDHAGHCRPRARHDRLFVRGGGLERQRPPQRSRAGWPRVCRSALREGQREHSRPHHFGRNRRPADRHARVFHRQDEQRLHPRRRHRGSRPGSTAASTCRSRRACHSSICSGPIGKCWSASAISSVKRLRESSIYDELLVARPPKRLIGGITVKF